MATTIPAIAREGAAARSEAGLPIPAPPLVMARGLAKRFGRCAALEPIDLEVRRGEWLVLLGPNGAGKTTLLHLLAGVLRPDAGELLVGGRAPQAPEARKLLGFVPQTLAIYPRLSVRENLLFFARVLGVPRALRAERIGLGLELSGLAERASQRAGALSGGMQRRLNFACAVLHEPQLLVLDEPTAGVDPQSRQQIYAAIEAQRQAGVTLVCSTHLFDEAERLAERVVVMHRGRIRADGTQAALLSRHGARDLQSTVLQLTGGEGFA